MSDRSDGDGLLWGSLGDRRGGSFLDDFLMSILSVVGIGILLFAVSGVWPPMVAIESPSMEPNIATGDLVFVMEEERFPSDAQFRQTGVATVYGSNGTDYRKFNRPGDVVVYEPNGNEQRTPVIHRVVFWVNESERWYETKADERYVPEDVDGCEEMEFCPAPHDGFVTLGDNNRQYDQVEPDSVSSPVKPEWVIGTAEFRMPILGWLRLRAGVTGPADLSGGVSAAELAAG